jgi:hypothetical protein
MVFVRTDWRYVVSAGTAYEWFMALIPGALSGYYVWLLTTKYGKFNSLKYEALRIIRRIEYAGSEDEILVTRSENLEEVQYIGGELLTLKHRRAGKELFVLSAELLGVVEECRSRNFSAFKMNALMSNWQKQVRSLRPGANFFVPWGQI